MLRFFNVAKSFTLMVALLLAGVAFVFAEGIPFSGEKAEDLTRGISTADIQPPMKSDRSYLDAYTLWYQGDAGDSLMVTLLISNLVGPSRPGFALSYYPVSGPPLHSEQEFEAEALKLSGPPLDFAFGKNRLSESVGPYHVHLEDPDLGLELDLNLAVQAPGYRRGNGLVPVGDGAFFMAVLSPNALATGTLSLPGGKAVKLKGRAYLDHSWQEAWPHKVADSWFNLRFYGQGMEGAFTTWRTPDGDLFSHVVLSEGTKLIYGGAATLTLDETLVDEETSRKIPSSAVFHLEGGGEFKVSLGKPLERRDLLGDLNPILKGIVGALVARPYAWRYRAEGLLTLPPTSEPVTKSRQIKGVVLAERILVQGD